MNNLYKDPFDDELLTNQFQNSKNLSSLLINNKEIHKSVFHSVSASRYHYTLTQPLLSSVLLLSFMQSLKLFNEKEPLYSKSIFNLSIVWSKFSSKFMEPCSISKWPCI